MNTYKIPKIKQDGYAILEIFMIFYHSFGIVGHKVRLYLYKLRTLRFLVYTILLEIALKFL